MDRDYITKFRVPLDKILEAKKWKVGSKYQIVANVEQTGMTKERVYDYDLPIVSRKGKPEKPKERIMVEFKIIDVSAKDKALSNYK